MKKTILVISVATIFLVVIGYLAINKYTTVLWKTYSDEEISFRYPSKFANYVVSDGEKISCKRDNKQGLDDCISFKFERKPFDKNNIRTTGGTLPQEQLVSQNIGGKKFLIYADGDAAFYTYYYIYELTDKSGYYKLNFLTNTFSSWDMNRDITRILSSVEFKN